jgi:hypothetical protein
MLMKILRRRNETERRKARHYPMIRSNYQFVLITNFFVFNMVEHHGDLYFKNFTLKDFIGNCSTSSDESI